MRLYKRVCGYGVHRSECAAVPVEAKAGQGCPSTAHWVLPLDGASHSGIPRALPVSQLHPLPHAGLQHAQPDFYLVLEIHTQVLTLAEHVFCPTEPSFQSPEP